MGGVSILIKVIRSIKPNELTEEMQEQLAYEFKVDKSKAVWNKKFIREALLKECNNKCVYCEILIGPGNKEMHVDHFHYKDKYVDEVVKWENLMPSCPHCNKSKSTHDTIEMPILNPFKDNPKEYFYIKNYRYYSKNSKVDEIVRETIGVLGLNDTKDVVFLRFQQGEALSDTIQNIYELAEENKGILNSDTRKRNRVINGCKNILRKGTRTAEFGAFMATIIQTDNEFIKLKTLLVELNMWDEEMEELDKEVKDIVLPTHADE